MEVRRVLVRSGASGGLALVVDPFAEAFRVTGLRALGENLGRGAESLDRDELADILGVKTGIAQRDIAAPRVRDDRQRAEIRKEEGRGGKEGGRQCRTRW